MVKKTGIPQPTAEMLCKRAELLFNSQERRNFEVLWEDLSTFLLPQQHSDFSVNFVQNKGEKRTQKIYDSTGVKANYELASIMHSTLTPPSLRWCKLQFADEKDRQDKKANEWLEASITKMHDIINASNFSQEFGAAYKSYTALGNAIVIIEEGDEKEGGGFSGISCRGWHLAGLVFAENRFGVVDTVFRRLKMTGVQAMQRWPKTLPEDIVKKYESNPDDECEFLHVIMPRSQTKKTSLGKYVRGGEPFASIYIATQSKMIVEDTGYREFPVVVLRGDKSEGEVYARGPGSVVLPDVKTLNAIVKSYLQSLQLAARPVVIVEERNQISDINVQPGSTIVVKNIEGIKEFITGARFEVSDKAIERLVMMIRSGFFLDKLVIPPRDTRGEMTAYEVAQLRVDMQRILGPLVDRLQSEALGPAAKRIFNLCMRGGVFGNPPASVRNKPIRIEYVNPISRSQNAEDLTAMAQWLQTAAGLMQMGKQDAIDMINGDKVMEHSASVLNVPSLVRASPEEVKKVRDERAQMQQQLMQQEAAVKQADVNAKNAKAQPAPAPDEGGELA